MIQGLGRRCHAAGWAHGRVAKRPFRETCRWASPSLFFRLHVLLAPLCAYPTRFLSRCGGCATPHCLPLREKHLAPAAQLLFRLRDSLCGCDPRLRASCHAARPPRRAAFIRGSSSRHSRCGLRYKRATGTFAHAAVSPPCPLSSPMRLPYALLCHAARPPRRATAHCSAEHAAGLRPACFSVCAVRCCPAPGRSALLFILPAFSPSGQPWRRPCA